MLTELFLIKEYLSGERESNVGTFTKTLVVKLCETTFRSRSTHIHTHTYIYNIYV